MSTAVDTRDNYTEIVETALLKGDLSKLTPRERTDHYLAVCKSLGLNPLTKPFAYLTLNGRMVLYALRDCTDQLRAIHNISVIDLSQTERDGVCIVTAKVRDGDGRTDTATGAVTIAGLKGDALANQLMKCETKAKRRATLSICGLGFLDETELETIPAGARNGTLPKKDARDIFNKLQKDIADASSYEFLKQWGNDAKERIEVLPTDWQEILRLRYQEKIVELRQLGASDIARAEAGRDDGTEVVWDDEEPPPPPTVPADKLTPSQKKRAQLAGACCTDPVFRKFLIEEFGALARDEKEAADIVRSMCGVASRAEIVPGTPAADMWDELYGQYLAWKEAV